MRPRLIVYIAASVDGRIATADGGVDWLKPFDSADYGFESFMQGVDGIVMGRTTFDQVRGFGPWPYADAPVMVLTSRRLADAPPGVEPAPSARAAIDRLGALGARRVWNVGGGRTIGAFLEIGAVDELRLLTIPVVLGAGPSLVAGLRRTAGLRLDEQRLHPNGVVELRYGPGGI